MLLTLVNLAKKAKADRIVVICKSVATGHVRHMVRSRLGDKMDFMDLDPLIQRPVLYKEEKKMRSVRDHQLRRNPRLLYSNIVCHRHPSIADELSDNKL